MDPLKAKQRLQMAMIIWLAMLWSAGLYLILSFVLAQELQTYGDIAVLYNMGLGLSLIGLVVGHFPKFRLNSDIALKSQIIALALCEACAMAGFILIAMTDIDPMKARSMMGLGFIGMATMFPSRKRMALPPAV